MTNKLKHYLIFLIIITISIQSLLLTGCSSKNSENTKEIRIAEQFGLAYAPIQIMKEKKYLEKELPGVTIKWSQLANTVAIREAMIADEVDAGFMAIPPFLIGWSNGMEWKIASGLSSSPIGLVTNKSSINSLIDINETDKIALPQPGSIQHILLSMASQRLLGDAHKFDNQLVTMSHPDGLNALLAHQDITAHFTSPPYLFKELENPDLHEVISGEEAFGKEFTFIVGVTTNDFHNNNPDLYTGFIKALNDSIDFMENNKEESSKILSSIYDIPEKDLLRYFNWPGNKYSTTIKGLDEFSNFMLENQYINKKYDSYEEVLWEDAKYER